MDLFYIIIIATPAILLYWLIDWELAYYKKHKSYLHYRSFKARIPVYLHMVFVAVGTILVALPFIILGITE